MNAIRNYKIYTPFCFKANHSIEDNYNQKYTPQNLDKNVFFYEFNTIEHEVLISGEVYSKIVAKWLQYLCRFI